jgi:hypothetical protein
MFDETLKDRSHETVANVVNFMQPESLAETWFILPAKVPGRATGSTGVSLATVKRMSVEAERNPDGNFPFRMGDKQKRKQNLITSTRRNNARILSARKETGPIPLAARSKVGGFELRSMHSCIFAFFCVMPSCVGTGLAMGRYPSKESFQNV